MRYIQFMLIGSVIALLSATTAHASVIYNWHSTHSGPYVTATGGELVVTNAAYRSGSIDFHVNDPNYPGGTSPGVIYDDNNRITNSPVALASLYFHFTDNGRDAPGVSVHPGGQTFSDFQLQFTSSLAFNGDGTLTGYMFLLSDTDSDGVEASGTHGDWNIFNYGSDYFAGEQCGPNTCDGGSGYWQLSSRPADVPEPPVLPLFALGVLGLFSLLGLRRKV